MLRIVYFQEKENSPVKSYIDRIINEADAESKKGKDKSAGKKKRLAIRLLALIQHAAEVDGNVQPPAGKKLYSFPFSELRQKAGKNLIRIFYFTYGQKDLVLLHAYDKQEGEEADPKELKQAEENFKKYNFHPNKHALF